LRYIGIFYGTELIVRGQIDDLGPQMFDKHVKDSGIPPSAFTTCLAHATLALGAGVHPEIVSERLGYSTVAFTMDAYSHAIPSMEAEGCETIAKLVIGSAFIQTMFK
jgi:hypothetical protein